MTQLALFPPYTEQQRAAMLGEVGIASGDLSEYNVMDNKNSFPPF